MERRFDCRLRVHRAEAEAAELAVMDKFVTQPAMLEQTLTGIRSCDKAARFRCQRSTAMVATSAAATKNVRIRCKLTRRSRLRQTGNYHRGHSPLPHIRIRTRIRALPPESHRETLVVQPRAHRAWASFGGPRLQMQRPRSLT